MIDYFWELETPFANFLNEIFENYRRKFSLSGSGIYNLVTCNGSLYEIKFSNSRAFVNNDEKLTKDNNKNNILITLCNALKDRGIAYTTNSGKYLSFQWDKFICKVEIVKKMKEPV